MQIRMLESLQPESHLLHDEPDPGESVYECNECKETFSLEQNFVEHKKTHSGEKSPECTGCGEESSQASSLTLHLRSRPRRESYKCGECGKAFSQRGNFLSHQKQHTEERPSESKKTPVPMTTTVRNQRNTGNKPYACKECGKAFNGKSYLKEHEKIHTGEKPFECSQCGRAFSQKQYLIDRKSVV